MTGVKTNEKPGTRAEVRGVRSSATKARAVLDLIRGKEIAEADRILRFTERGIAAVIRKCLTSAVANAEHNDHQAADELYVAACFADEGPTINRSRPRARGRATRIRKRTCHITIIVSRLSEALAKREAIEDVKPSGRAARRAGVVAQAARRERVARSRAAQAAREAEAEGGEEHDHDHESIAETAEAEGVVDTTATVAEEASESEAEGLDDDADETAEDTTGTDELGDEDDEEEDDDEEND
jgi:large subunit ribosomal protein L22